MRKNINTGHDITSISKKKYYSRQTQLAIDNFPFSTTLAHKELIYAIAQIKEAAAFAHLKTGSMEKVVSNAIIKASREIQLGIFDDQFFLPGIQGGAGTSIHMNVNEVIASRAQELLGKKDAYINIHPNDHVNKSQSTNDVGPSALKIVSLELIKNFLDTLYFAEIVFKEKAKEFENVRKLGRTHLQDGVPTTLGDEFASYSSTISRGIQRLNLITPFFYELNLGGTAIGNSLNATDEYKHHVYKALRRITKLPLIAAENQMSQTSSQTDFVMLSQTICAIMIDFSKIANDFRLLSSGPNGGFSEIQLRELQPGSSIMPGKVNPVMPESVNQAYFVISGNNLAIEHAAHASQLELGVMFPVIADRLVSSLKLSNEAIRAFLEKCVVSVTAREDKCLMHLQNSTAQAVLLTPEMGYDKVSKMVKNANIEGASLNHLFLGPILKKNN